MARAITVLSIIVVLSFGFVLWQLSRHPGRVPRMPAGSSLLETRDDGSLYSVGLQLERFEQRLMDEEQRSAKLMNELGAVRKDREDLTRRVDVLQDEIRKLRRQVEPRPAPRPVTPPPPANVPAVGNAPAANAPVGNVPAPLPGPM